MSEFAENLRQEFLDKEYADAYTEEFLNLHIATQIKVLREQRDLTQAQLADMAGMRQERISVLENANYERWSIQTLRKLARAFDVTLRVTFETFSHTIAEIEGFSRTVLERKNREEDLSEPISPVVSENRIVELQSLGRKGSKQPDQGSAEKKAYQLSGQIQNEKAYLSAESSTSHHLHELLTQGHPLQPNPRSGSLTLQ